MDVDWRNYLCKSSTAVIEQLRALAEMKCDRILPGGNVDKRRGARKEPTILDEVFGTKCRAHDEELEWIPFTRSGHLPPKRHNSRQHACKTRPTYRDRFEVIEAEGSVQAEAKETIAKSAQVYKGSAMHVNLRILCHVKVHVTDSAKQMQYFEAQNEGLES